MESHGEPPLAPTGKGDLGGGGVLGPRIKEVKGGRAGGSSATSFFTSSFITLRPTSLTVLRPSESVDTVTLPVKLERTTQTFPSAVM